jgi:hypothetical protein
MTWLYSDEIHGGYCECDECDGERLVGRPVPDECLFDDLDRNHRYQDNPKQWKVRS